MAINAASPRLEGGHLCGVGIGRGALGAVRLTWLVNMARKHGLSGPGFRRTGSADSPSGSGPLRLRHERQGGEFELQLLYMHVLLHPDLAEAAQAESRVHLFLLQAGIDLQ